jgi:CBS domain-containing protein
MPEEAAAVSAGPRVADYMVRRPVTLEPATEINRAVSTLLDRGISGAPVVDAQGWLLGMLSLKDCLRAAVHASYYRDWGGTVADFMSQPAETLDAETGIVEAAETFLQSRYRRFPVVSDGRLVGQISRADILAAMRDQWG